jgi:O-methyltransferase domain
VVIAWARASPSCATGSVPSADTYLMSVVLHDWDNAAAARILRNVAAAAAPGARLVLLKMVIPEGDGPHFTKMMADSST